MVWIPYRPGKPLLIEAIRSVTHLVLAPGRGQLANPNFEPERARARRITRAPRIPPARFAWSIGFTSAAPMAGKPQSHWPRAQSHHWDPENFQCRAVFIQCRRVLVPGHAGAPKVQPVRDSRHGRIACKLFCAALQRAESRRFQSDRRDQSPTPSLVNGCSQKINTSSFLY